MKIKENAKQDFLEMIRKSWTYGKLSQKEKALFEKMMDHPSVGDTIIGDYKHRWNACESAYSMFLAGCGYDHQVDWREPKKEESMPTKREIKRVLRYLGENYE